MFCILLVCTFLLWLLLHNKSERWQSVPFKVIAILLIVGEAGKQIISIKQGYNFWHLPLHFCSTYFIWFSLAEFSVGKMRQTMQNVAFVATLYLCVALYSYPSGVLSSACDNVFKTYFTAHSFFFHHLVIFYMLLSIAFKRFKPKKTDALTWIVCFSVYFTVATICAYTLNENYFGILDGNMLPPIEPIRLVIGQFWYDAGLGFVLIFFGAGVLLLAGWISQVIEKWKTPKKVLVKE
ncbi:MAG: YwaF family protein [Clostridia bacterium]|nr:YwaF family protein [Clostridia bacterium]